MSSNKTPQLRFPGFTGKWGSKKLGKITTEIYQPQTITKDQFKSSGYPVYGANGIIGYFDSYNHETAQIAITCRGASCGTVNMTSGKCWITGNAMVVNLDKVLDKYDKNYIYQVLCFCDLNNIITGSGQPQIVRSPLLNFEIPLPPTREEQLEIADCLKEMDKIITIQGEKVKAIKEKKKGLMQQLFPKPGESIPQLRFPGFEDEWSEKKMSDVFTRLTEKNSEDNKNVLTISAQFGLISQLEFFKKSVSASDVTGYYLLHRGDFAYNKSSSQGKPVGAIKPLKLYDKGVVSTLYICFRCKDPNAIGFWEQYFDAGVFDKEIMTIAQEGARNHGLLNVPTNDFFGLSVKMPKPAEQLKIAECLSALDELIASESAKLDSLKDHKKGLMQQLFPQPSK